MSQKDYRVINVKIREIAVPKSITENNNEFAGLKKVKIYKMGYVTIVVGIGVGGGVAALAYHISRKPTTEEIFRIRKELLGSEIKVYLDVDDEISDPCAVFLLTKPL